MLLDANVLLYAIDSTSQFHPVAKDWLETTLNDDRRVALTWQTLGAVARIATHPRVMTAPLNATEVGELIADWLSLPIVWIPPTGPNTVRIFCELLARHQLTGNLITDAQLAALAIEHGLELISADSDFARIPEVNWRNPFAS